MVNYYQILGVAQNATVKEINSAYKKLALRYHPDKSNGETTSLVQFRKIQEAIEVLRDPTQRRRHDDSLRMFIIREHVTPYQNVPDGWPLWDAWYAEDSKWRAQKDEEERQEEIRKVEAEKRRGAEHEAERQREQQMRTKRMKAMRANVLRDEEELEREEQEEIAGAATKPCPVGRKQILVPNLSSDRVDIDGRYGPDFGSTGYESDGASVPAEVDDLLMTFSDNEYEDYEEEGQSVTSDAFTDLGHEAEVGGDASDSIPRKNIKPKEPDVLDADPIDRVTPFFEYKLANGQNRYSIKDFYVEMTGFILESFQGWLEEQRLGFPGALPTEVANFADNSKICHHLGPWTKTFHAQECDVCHRWMPLYTLTCHSCETKACVSCKYQQKT